MSALTISAILMCFMCKICGWTIPTKPGFVVLRLTQMKEKRLLQMQVMEMHVGLDLTSSSLLLLDIWLQLTDNLQTSKKVVIQILDTFVSKHIFNLKALISFKTLQHLKALTGWKGTSDTLNYHSSFLSCRCWW
jgi:hypothetical protein